MIQLTEEGVPPGLGFTNKGFVIDVMMIGGHLEHSVHEVVRMLT